MVKTLETFQMDPRVFFIWSTPDASVGQMPKGCNQCV